MKRRSGILVIAALLTALLSAAVWAEEAVEPKVVNQPEFKVEIIHVNPVDEALGVRFEKPDADCMTTAKSTVESMAEAAVYLREQMENRVTEVTIVLNNHTYVDNAGLKADMFTILFSAFEHTGVPTQGDYILRHYSEVKGNGGHNGISTATFIYTITYKTTLEQENDVGERIEELYAQWDEEYGFCEMSDYEKICTIYDYICDNVVYDYDNLNDTEYTLKYSAYAALINGTAVCQGYANLFYRMVLEAGVDNRIIVGYGDVNGNGNGDSNEYHAWNIVELGEYYYYLDSTWDAGRDPYNYFLLGSTIFCHDHIPDATNEYDCDVADYPISAEDYEIGVEIPTLTASICDTTGKIVLSWTKVNGADGYELYRADAADGEYVLLYDGSDTGTTDQTSVVGQTYYYKIRARDGDLYSDFSEPFAYTCELTAPVVTASVNDETGKPMLAWNAVPGAEKYEVFRCDTANGTYIRMTTVTGTTYTNGTAVAGRTYYYKVRAVKGTTTSACSKICEVTCKGSAGLVAPVVTGSVNAATGKPMLTWDAVPGAEKYEIFRCDTADGTYIRMTTVTGTTYTNGSAVAGQTYYYKVRAVGAVTSPTSAILQLTCVPATPVVTGSVDAASGKPMLRWNAVAGAEKYEIFRCDTENGTYIRMTTITGTTYTNGTAEVGKTYYYKVRAVVGDVVSASSAVRKVTCTLAAPVVYASVDTVTGKPVLTWDAVPGAEKYEVFRCDTANGTYIRMTTVTGTVYTNGTAVEGKTYYYKVRAVKGSLYSACSEVLEVTCAAPMSLDAPVVTSFVNEETGKPMLTWDAVPGAEKYEVFRCDTANGTYIRMYTTTETTYSNGSAVAGKTYYYKVRAVVGSVYSACCEIQKVTCIDPAALTAPVVTASVNAATGKPTLTWNAVAGAEKYEIFRCDTANGTYIRMYTTTATTYSNGSAVAGKTYFYKVRAVKGTTNGPTSAVLQITCAPAAPVVTSSVDVTTGKPTLTWNAVAGAEKYEIFRCDTANGTYIRMYTTTETTYSNGSAVAGKTYYYKVRAVVGTVNGACSAVHKVTCVAPATAVSAE